MKKDKIIYWTTTGLVTTGMLLSAGLYLSQNPALMENFKAIGIPFYLIGLLGVAKLLGAIALISPIWDRIKEWAYAGFAFTFLGAIWTHISTGTSLLPPLVFLVLLAVSYFFRLRVNSGRLAG